jgi:YidC/Oxa1 family membrane protein insertase
MDRNSIIGLTLIFVILVTFAYINQPSEEELAQIRQQQENIALTKREQDSIALLATVLTQEVNILDDTTRLANELGSFAILAQGEESFVSIENEEIKLVLSTKGGRLQTVELKKYKTYTGNPLLMLDGKENTFNYVFATRENKTIQTQELYFTPEISADKLSVKMIAQIADGSRIEQQYKLGENSQTVYYNLVLDGMNTVIARNSNYLDLNINHKILTQEKNVDAERKTSTIYYRFVDDEPSFLAETQDEQKALKTPVQWISYKQQYFNTTFIADEPFDNAYIQTESKEDSEYVKYMKSNISIPYSHKDKEQFGMQMYFGPNHYKTLAKLDIELERIIPMGWGIFRWVNKYVVINVFYFLNKYISSFGIIILLLTIFIKTLLTPLVYRSYLSSAKMRVLKPEIDEIKSKYGDDMARVQQENMKLYRKAGVNPLGGCVPVLLQLPILFALFQFFPSAFELRQQTFLWAEDLSTYDSIINLPFKIPFYGNHVSLFALLMTTSSLAYTYYNNQMNTGINDQMKWLTYTMPVLFLFVLNGFPAGLNYYYFLSNLVTIGQQLTIRRFVNEDKLHVQIQENKKKPVKKSAFEQRIEDMARKRGIDVHQQGPKGKRK